MLIGTVLCDIMSITVYSLKTTKNGRYFLLNWLAFLEEKGHYINDSFRKIYFATFLGTVDKKCGRCNAFNERKNKSYTPALTSYIHSGYTNFLNTQNSGQLHLRLLFRDLQNFNYSKHFNPIII